MRDENDESKDSFREFYQYMERRSPGSTQAYVSDTEQQFVEAVEVILDRTIRILEGNAATHSGLGELALSTMLTDLISQSGVPCEKERYYNGHVDVTIYHPRSLPYQYLGECKIYKGFKRHCDGCDQLLNRYSSGRDMRGFLLEFFTRRGMYQLMGRLKDQFDRSFPLRMTGTSQDHTQIKGAFISMHSHFTEAQVEVLHIGCNLFHPPTKGKRGLD